MQAFANICKYIFITFFFVFLPYFTFAQTDQDINLHLEKFHNEYTLGTSVMVTGLFCTGIGYILNNSKSEPPGQANTVIFVAMIVTSIGVVIQIDSHKHLNPHRPYHAK